MPSQNKKIERKTLFLFVFGGFIALRFAIKNLVKRTYLMRERSVYNHIYIPLIDFLIIMFIMFVNWYTTNKFISTITRKKIDYRNKYVLEKKGEI